MSTLYSGSLLPLAVLIWPLVLGLVPILPRWRNHALLALPLAPLPALYFAALGAPGEVAVHDLLLGVHLAAVPGGAMLLGMTALVWTVAGIHAATTIPPGPQSGILAGFWCLTLAGNLGVFLSGDIITFYVAFAAVSLAAWFLVVHDRSKNALAAGRLYLVLAILGEAALLVGLLIGGAIAEDLSIASVRAALPNAPLGHLAVLALIVGFGIKAGMVPLHLWLPVAHPAAPVPGSAVLSGAIVKAGLIGMVLFIPAGSGWGTMLIAAGLIGGFGAALWGLTQSNPKAILAYSTVSQMGLMLTLVGAGSGGVAYFALHHGVAKAALFLCVGVMGAVSTQRQRSMTLVAGMAIALSVAGLPLSGGALAKLAAKDGMSSTMALAMTISSVTTTLVLGWFLLCLATENGKSKQHTLWPQLYAGMALLGGMAVFLPWILWGSEVSLPNDYPLQVGNLIEGLWPVIAGAGALLVVRRKSLPNYPPGDMLMLLGKLASSRPRALRMPQGRWPRGAKAVTYTIMRGLLHARHADSRLEPWPRAGFTLVVTSLVLAFAIGMNQN